MIHVHRINNTNKCNMSILIFFPINFDVTNQSKNFLLKISIDEIVLQRIRFLTLLDT